MNGSTLPTIGPDHRSPPAGTFFSRFCRYLFLFTVLCLSTGLTLASDAIAAEAKSVPSKSAKASTVKKQAAQQKTTRAADSSTRKTSGATAASTSSSKRTKTTKKSNQKTRKPLFVRSLMPVDEREALKERGIYSGFGPRAVSKKQVRLHKGIDISAPKGSVITAYNDGKVIFSGRRGGYGIAVVVEQIDGRQALYAHMSQAVANVGDEVRRGDKIGLVGRTGRTTGAHLHFELIDEGENLDPSEHVWHGSELVLAPGDPDPSNMEGRTSFAASSLSTRTN